jgi:hypothetical protein
MRARTRLSCHRWKKQLGNREFQRPGAKTAETDRANILLKLNFNSITELVLYSNRIRVILGGWTAVQHYREIPRESAEFHTNRGKCTLYSEAGRSITNKQ